MIVANSPKTGSGGATPPVAIGKAPVTVYSAPTTGKGGTTAAGTKSRPPIAEVAIHETIHNTSASESKAQRILYAEATWVDDTDDLWDGQLTYEKQKYAQSYQMLASSTASKQILSPKLQAVTAARSTSALGSMPSTKLGQVLNRRPTSVPLMPVQSIIAFCFLTPATALACAAGALLVGAGALGAANTIATQNNRASNVGGSSSYNSNSLRYGGSGILNTMYTITRTMATAAAYWLSNPESNYEGVDLLQETPDMNRGFPLITATALPPPDGREIIPTQTPTGDILEPTITLVPTPPEYVGTPAAPTFGDSILYTDWGITPDGERVRLRRLSDSDVHQLGLHGPKQRSEYGGRGIIFYSPETDSYWIADPKSRSSGAYVVNEIEPEG